MYYPKSQIIIDRYTNGGELFVRSTNLPYQGYYHIVASGIVYSGRTPYDGQPLELVFNAKYNKEGSQVIDAPPPSPTSIFKLFDFGVSKVPYDNIRKLKEIDFPPFSLIEPQFISPIPKYPSFIRYFVKKTNNTTFIEIDKPQYQAFSNNETTYNWPNYTPFFLPWTTGDDSRKNIEKINRSIVTLTETRLKLYGLSQYITNYIQFAI